MFLYISQIYLRNKLLLNIKQSLKVNSTRIIPTLWCEYPRLRALIKENAMLRVVVIHVFIHADTNAGSINFIIVVFNTNFLLESAEKMCIVRIYVLMHAYTEAVGGKFKIRLLGLIEWIF